MATSGPTYAPSGCDATTYSPNYITTNSGSGDSSGGAGFSYWQHFPLTVYLAPTDDATRAATLAGFNEWVSATGGRVSYTLISSSTSADVTVAFSAHQGSSQPGLGTMYFDSNGAIARVTMQLFVLSANGSADPAANADGTNQSRAAHMFGHVLGIGPHSLDAGDLMSAAIRSQGGAEQVTTRDLNTLKTIYCNNFPTASALARKSAAIVSHRDLAQE